MATQLHPLKQKIKTETLCNSRILKVKSLPFIFTPKTTRPAAQRKPAILETTLICLKKKNISILGVSTDDAVSHKKFETKQNLNFPLLDDSSHEIVKSYGVWGPKKFMGRTYEGTHRTTFLIDEKGLIEHIIEKVKTKEHAEQIVSTWGLD